MDGSDDDYTHARCIICTGTACDARPNGWFWSTLNGAWQLSGTRSLKRVRHVAKTHFSFFSTFQPFLVPGSSQPSNHQQEQAEAHRQYHTTMAASSTVSSFWSPSLQQAIDLDISILQAVLQRNRCSHGRCKYYQRLAMALKALQRDSVLAKLPGQLESLQEDLRLERHRRSSASLKRKGKGKSDEFWVLANTTESSASPPSSTSTSLLLLIQLSEQVAAAAQRTAAFVTDSIRRLEYAAEMLWVEIARGFFLPFCTVAVAAVARIRTLLRQWFLAQQSPLAALHNEIHHDWSSIVNQETRTTEKKLFPRLWKLVDVQALQEQGLLSASDAETDTPPARTTGTVADARRQQCRAVWESLGIPAQRQQEYLTTLPTATQSQSTPSSDAVSSYQGALEATTIADTTTTHLENDVMKERYPPVSETADAEWSAFDDQQHADVGESVGLQSDEAAGSELDVDYSQRASAVEYDEIDQNQALVQTLRRSKNKLKFKERKAKRAPTEGTKLEKRKQKKAKKEDFFDTLFG